MRLAARYCDELNLNVFPDQVPELLEVFGERCAEIGRDPKTVELNWGTNQIMRYKNLKVTGGQRFAEPHELAYQDPERVANVGTRAEELAAWNELGFDRCTAGIPGLHNTDEGLYEFIDDCRTAGIDFFDRQPAHRSHDRPGRGRRLRVHGPDMVGGRRQPRARARRSVP